MLKRFFTALLALVMVLGMLPATHAHATETDEIVPAETVAEETTPEETVPEETEEATEEAEETTQPVTEETTATEETSAPTEETTEAMEATTEVIEVPEAAAEEILAPESEQPALAAITHRGTCGDNLTWSLSDDGVLTISGTGAMTDYARFDSSVPWYEWRDSIYKVVVCEGVKSIGSYAFQGTRGLSISIPKSVTAYGSYIYANEMWHIFYAGTRSQWLQIAKGYDDFYDDGPTFHYQSDGSQLKNYRKISCTIKRLYKCDLCDEVLYHYSYEHIFQDDVCVTCGVPEALDYFYRNGEMVVYGYHGSAEELVIPAKVEGYPVTEISAGAFRDAKNLKRIVLPEGLTTIAEEAFLGSGLESIAFPDTMKKIGVLAFADCSNLKEITFGKGALKLGGEVFANCDSLTSVIIPDTVTQVEYGTFAGCNQLVSVTMPKKLSKCSSVRLFDNCPSLKEVVLPENLTRIGFCMFSGCSSLTKVSIPASVKYIDEQAFGDCSSLVSIKLPVSVVTLSTGAFCGCTSLTSISIPEGVKKIDGYVFENCPNLVAIALPKSLQKVEAMAFYGSNHLCHVFYAGTAKQWNTLLSNSDWAFRQLWFEQPVHLGANLSSLKAYKKNYCDIKTFFKCNLCKETDEGIFGKKYLSIRNWDATHDFTDVDWTVVQKESCEETGHYKKYCKKCEYFEEKYIDAFGHAYGEWVVTKEATPTKEGSKYRICSRCQYKQTKSIGKLGSRDSGTCGKNVNWYLSTDGTLTIMGTGAMKNYGWDSAAAPWDDWCNKIKRIDIRDGVTSIGDFAFNGCLANEVTIPSSVKTIGERAFRHTMLKTVVIPDGVATIKTRAFEAIDSLTAVEIGANVTSIGSYAFYMCENLESVDLQCKIKTLANYVFAECYALKSIQLPKTLTSIGQGAFDECQSLQSIVIPEGVTKIGKNAFAGCAGLTTISIPRTVTSIGPTALRSCSAVKTVFFCGTEEQWKSFNKPLDKIGTKNVTLQYHSFVDERCVYCLRKNGPCLVKHTGQEELRDAKAYTCTEAGYSGDVYCTVCGDVVKTGKVIPAAHKYKAEVYKPTYTKKGYTEHTCSVCGHSYQDTPTKALGLPKPSVKISVNNTTGKPVITWKAIDEVKQYWVYRATSKDGDYACVAKTEQTDFEDTTAVAGKKYYYKVRAIGIDDSKSEYSAIVNVTCKCIAPVVSAFVTESSGKIKLSWKSVKSAKTYYIYRAKTADGNYEKIAYTTKTYYTDSSAAVGITYHYKVKAIATSSAANSIYSNRVQAMRICAQPDLAVKVASSGKPSLTWIKVSGAKEYKILRAESQNGEYQFLTTTTSTSYTDKTAEFDKDYWYQVDVVGSKTGTDNDTDATVKVHTTCAKPSVSIKLSSKKPKVSWKPVEGATKYYVYRATSKSGKYTKVATVIDATSYTDKKAKKGKTYYYKVKAIAANAAANSTDSSVKSIKSK